MASTVLQLKNFKSQIAERLDRQIGDGFRTQQGDVFEIESPVFGRQLRNELLVEECEEIAGVRAL